MTAAEPGPWELQRALEQQRADIREGLAGINSRLDQLVTTGAFAAEQRRVDEQLSRLTKDITDEAVARREGDEAQQKSLDKLTALMRWYVVAIIVPVALFVANLYMSKSG